MSEGEWFAIKDSHVNHIWKCVCEDDECDHRNVEVGPDWYQHNGTPICMSGVDMEYDRTEILT